MILFDSASTPYSIGGLDKLICSQMEWSNIAARTVGQSVPDQKTQGTLSIKCAYGGEEVYLAGNRNYRVTDNRLLILNCGEYYSSRTETPHDVESFCLFFHPRFVDEGLRTRISPADHLLDLPSDGNGQPLHFLDVLHDSDSQLHIHINRFRKKLSMPSANRPTKEEVHETFHLLLQELLVTHKEVVAKVGRLGVVRKGTRVELYRRVERGREFIEDNLAAPLHLADIAETACLSPHYLLRLFKQVYRETPHQYMTRRRIEKACELLAGTNESITGICYDVGFESPASFSLLFRRYRGLSPRAYRQTRRKG